jgi:hypothetical protein
MSRRRRKAIQVVEADLVLTQFGNKERPIGGRAFKNRPPFPEQVNELSLLSGEQSVNVNPLHVSVLCMDETHVWTDDDSEKFDSCFDEPVWGEG